MMPSSKATQAHDAPMAQTGTTAGSLPWVLAIGYGLFFAVVGVG